MPKQVPRAWAIIMTEVFKIKVSCPHCEMPVSYIYYNHGGFGKDQIIGILNAVKYKEDYSISVVEIPDPKKYIHLYRIEDSITLLHFIKNLRLSRTVLKETVTIEKKLVDTLVATKYRYPFICQTTEWHGTQYTFINNTMSGDHENRMIIDILGSHGYSTGISKFGDPFVRNAKIEVERVDHPLFKKGVWKIYDITEIHGHVYKIEKD